MERIDLRSVNKIEQLAIRKRAVRMVKKGETKQRTSELLGVSRFSVNKWCAVYAREGMKGLRLKSKGRAKGSGKLLSDDQEVQVQRMITDKMPDQLKLPYSLWTRSSIKELIKREFGVELAIRTVGDYLASWGFTPQKPKKRAYEQSDKKVQEWIEKEYPSIKSRAKKEGAEIHWGDETGVRNDCQHGRSYAPKGKTPVKRKTGKRLSVNMISTVTNQGKVRFMTYEGSMDAKRFIDFLKRLIKGSTTKVYLILDNLRVHHSKFVKEWVESKKDEIELFFLPSYSPERNPDEYLNCDLKQGISQRIAPKTNQELKKNVKSHMKILQNNPERVKKYFQHQSIKYAA